MIEINLLPEEKRAKMRAAGAAKPGVPAAENLKKLVYVVPAAAALLLAVHGYYGILQLTGALKLAELDKKLQSFQPQMKGLEGFKTVFENNSQDEQVMRDLAATSSSWSRKLNRLSADLPPGIWINEMAVSPRMLSLKCSAVSLEADEVDLINRFLSALKDDNEFFTDFASFDLGSVQRRTLGTFEIADFTVSMEVKTK